MPWTVTLTRAWNWGIAVLADRDGQVPDVDTDALVSVGASGVVLLVRHAQDTDGAEPATATLHLTDSTDPGGRPVVADAVIATPSGGLTVGDAEDGLTVRAPADRTRIVVRAADPDDRQPDELWVQVRDAR